MFENGLKQKLDFLWPFFDLRLAGAKPKQKCAGIIANFKFWNQYKDFGT